MNGYVQMSLKQARLGAKAGSLANNEEMDQAGRADAIIWTVTMESRIIKCWLVVVLIALRREREGAQGCPGLIADMDDRRVPRRAAKPGCVRSACKCLQASSGGNRREVGVMFMGVVLADPRSDIGQLEHTCLYSVFCR